MNETTAFLAPGEYTYRELEQCLGPKQAQAFAVEIEECKVGGDHYQVYGIKKDGEDVPALTDLDEKEAQQAGLPNNLERAVQMLYR